MLELQQREEDREDAVRREDRAKEKSSRRDEVQLTIRSGS
jgi:hypothetical protein